MWACDACFNSWSAEVAPSPNWLPFCVGASLGSVLTWLLMSLAGCAAVDKPRLTLDAQVSVAAVSKQVQSRIEAGEINVPITFGEGAVQGVLAMIGGLFAYPAARAVRRRLGNGRIPDEVREAIRSELQEQIKVNGVRFPVRYQPDDCVPKE
jgi:hypothetical protein